jgi:hypothetical protein
MSEFKLKNMIGEGTKMFWKYQQIVMKVLVLKLKIKCVNSRISGSQSFCGPFMIPVTTFIYCDVCRKAGQDITGKTKFVESFHY